MNLSMGRLHQGIDYTLFDYDTFEQSYHTYDAPSFSDILGLGPADGMDFLNQDLRAHNPFRDFYIEASGWRKNNTIYYKIGYNSNYSYDGSKNYQSRTFPAQFVIGFDNQNSLTIYYETQKTKDLFEEFVLDDDGEQITTYDYHVYKSRYMSLSYHIAKFGSITYFYDKEVKRFNHIDYDDVHSDDAKRNSWEGFELTLELSSTMQFSIFKGSQKGGLVCTNGICAVQPSFEDGVKLTLRALF